MNGAVKDLLIAIGKLHRSHGVFGEIKLQPYFDLSVIESLLGSKLNLSPERGDNQIRKTMLACRPGGKRLIVKFDGVGTVEEARALTHHIVRVARQSMPDLPDGQYYYEELIGLKVIDPDGTHLGILADFFPAGEKDVWEVKHPDGGELLLPCIPEVIHDVDLVRGVIIAKPMEIDE